MKELKRNIKFAWKYTKKEKISLLLFLICNIIKIIISVIVPIFSARIIVSLTNDMLMQVLNITIVLLLCETINNIIRYINNYLSQRIYRESFIDVQTDLGSEILKLENKCLDSNSSGVFIQRLINDASNLADIFTILNIYLTHILTDIGIFGAIFVIDKKVFLYVIITIFIIFIVSKNRIGNFNENDKKYRKINENTSGFVGELVRGVRDIKMLNAEDSFIDELHSKVYNLNSFRYDMMKSNRKYLFIEDGLKDIFDIGLIFLLVYFIYTKELTIASSLIIHNYMGRVSSIVDYGSMFYEKIKSFNLSCTRIFNIIDSSEFTKERFGKKHLDKVDGNFEFKNVSFSYNKDIPVLKNVSFKVKSRETIGFVGKSGSGKTTLFSLLCKMYDVDSGTITIDGVNINELDKDSIRGNITIISQNPYIFNLSIRDNLRLVKKDLTEEEMVEACQMACLTDFINVLPDKYDTIVGEGGVSLSGGQRQRLAIARALVQKTEIILFDEATSALDNHTQELIQQAINNLQNKYTILIIAHRLSTIINCDRILFLNDGVIEDSGTHEELLNNCNGYKELYESELRK